jgi:glycine/D-amino acid oxidase-like deaminating enzyme
MPPPAHRSGLVVDLVAEAPMTWSVLRGPDVHVRTAGPTRVRVRSDQVDSRLPDPPDFPGGVPRALVDELLERVGRTVPELASAPVERIRIGTASFPHDGRPSVGAVSSVPGYYEALTNSGVTVGPLMGRLLAEYIATGVRAELLDDCLPDRLRATANSSPE